MLRKATQQLLSWKTKANNRVMIIRGTGRVGKTYLAKDFAENFCKETAYVDCDGNQRMKLLFESRPDYIRLKAALQIETGVSISKDDTLIILDNIDKLQGAEEILACFNGSGYSVIAITSNVNGEGSKELESITLCPMSFCEYLEAKGFNDLSELVFSRDWELKKVFASKYYELLREYLFVGGMPECVCDFIEFQDYARVRNIQKKIIEHYESEFSGLVSARGAKKLKTLYASVPIQLTKKNNKFIYDKVNSGARAKEFENALFLLLQSGIVAKVSRMTKPSIALMMYSGNTFKMFMNDVGLLGAYLETEVCDYGDNSIFDSLNGALLQQFVWQQLLSIGVNPRYWSAYKGTSKMDFLVLSGDSIIPIETMGTENKKAKNMKVYLEKFSPRRAIRLSVSDYRNDNGFINVPIFAAEAVMEVCGGNIIMR